MNNFELTAALVTAPRTAFAALKDQPRFWFPLLTGCLSIAAMLLWYYSIVDYDWLMDRMLSSNPRMSQMTDQQREQAMRMMSPSVIMWSSVISVVVFLAVARVLEALYLTLAGNVVNARQSFVQWFSLCCWTALPHVIGTATMAVYLLTAGTNQIGNEDLSLLSLNQLFFNVPMGEQGSTLLSSLTLIHPWVWWLSVVGVQVWTGRSWLFSSIFALTPIVILYGGWAAWSFR